MMDTLCPVCGKPILPAEPFVSWLTKNQGQETVDRGAFHLSHIGRS